MTKGVRRFTKPPANATPPSQRRLSPEVRLAIEALEATLAAAFKRDPAAAAAACARLLKEAEDRMLYGYPTAAPPRGILHG